MACIMLACNQLIFDEVASSIAHEIFSAHAKNAFIEHFATLHA